MHRRQFLQTSSQLAASSLVLGASPWALGTINSPLESAVDRYVKTQRRQGLISSNERTAWSIFDMTAREKLVSINEDVPLQAASLIKPFICQAFFFLERYEGYIYGPKTRALMESMIVSSSNTATNDLMRIVGGPSACERILKRYAGGIFAQTSIVEYIPANGRTYRNRASAHDYSRFLYAMWSGALPGANEMRRIMGLNNRDRLRSAAHGVPSSVSVYDKTGSTAMLCGNIGIMVAKGRNGRDYPYTVIGLIERNNRTANYGHWMKVRGNVIRGVSGLAYDYLKKRYPLI